MIISSPVGNARLGGQNWPFSPYGVNGLASTRLYEEDGPAPGEGYPPPPVLVPWEDSGGQAEAAVQAAQPEEGIDWGSGVDWVLGRLTSIFDRKPPYQPQPPPPPLRRATPVWIAPAAIAAGGLGLYLLLRR